MALFKPTVGAKYASWFHPTWRLSGGVAVDADTSEALAGLDAGEAWGVNSSHGWISTVTYATGARVESASLPIATYESLQDGNVGHAPASSPTWWRVVGIAEDDLGADSEHWITTPGLLRMDRSPVGDSANVHLYSRAGGVSGMRWSEPCLGGQFSMVSTGTVPHPAVRVAPDSDTCYFARLVNDGYGGWLAQLCKVINGVESVVATGDYAPDPGNATLMVYAYEDRIGVSMGGAESDLTTGWPGTGWVPASYGIAQVILLEVVDASIPESVGGYIGVRAPAGVASIHEWYGGTFGLLTAHAGTPSGSSLTLSGMRRPSSTVAVTRA